MSACWHYKSRGGVNRTAGAVPGVDYTSPNGEYNVTVVMYVFIHG